MPSTISILALALSSLTLSHAQQAITTSMFLDPDFIGINNPTEATGSIITVNPTGTIIALDCPPEQSSADSCSQWEQLTWLIAPSTMAITKTGPFASGFGSNPEPIGTGTATQTCVNLDGQWSMSCVWGTTYTDAEGAVSTTTGDAQESVRFASLTITGGLEMASEATGVAASGGEAGPVTSMGGDEMPVTSMRGDEMPAPTAGQDAHTGAAPRVTAAAGMVVGLAAAVMAF